MYGAVNSQTENVGKIANKLGKYSLMEDPMVIFLFHVALPLMSFRTLGLPSKFCPPLLDMPPMFSELFSSCRSFFQTLGFPANESENLASTQGFQKASMETQ